ncbi:MAG: hypothetical protein WA803_13085 [Steroidobacteraceae bacterium]
MEDGLSPRRAAGLGHDGADDVDELCQAGCFDAVGIVHQRNEHAANDQCILEIVDFLDERRCYGTT